MGPVTVFIANLDALPRDILGTLLDTRGIEVVGTDAWLSPKPEPPADERGEYWDRLVGAIERCRPNAVVFGGSDQRLADQLSALVDAKLLILEERGASVACCEWLPGRRVESSPGSQELVRLIRECADQNPDDVRTGR